jgi:hypothetical protein
MSSAITTATINPNYPNPGVNNSSQGFRDNFAGIKNNLDTAATEISDLQSKAILKSALTGTSLDNNMNNVVISNAQTLNFRQSMYNLGSSLSGTVTVDLTKGDVHYGTIQDPNSGVGAIYLNFAKWAPSGTQSTVEVVLTVVAGQTIKLADNVAIGIETIEGASGFVAGRFGATITVPAGVTTLHYQFISRDCGTTVTIVPVNRPRVEVPNYQAIPRIDFTITTSGNNIKFTNPNLALYKSTSDITVFLGGILEQNNGTTYTLSGDTLTWGHIGVGLIGTQITIIPSATSTISASNAPSIQYTPPSAASAGVKGQMMYDNDFFYVCVDTNQWKRVALASW